MRVQNLPYGGQRSKIKQTHFSNLKHQQFHSKCLLRGIYHIQETIFMLLTFAYFRNWHGYAHHAVSILYQEEGLIDIEL